MLLQDVDSLQREQWIELMRTASVGRLIFTEHALPAVHLVDFRWWRGDVVIRITDASVLSVVSRNQVVAFEADTLGADLDRGWSVTVVGHCAVITEVPDLIELCGMFSRPSSGSRCDYFVRIRSEMVSGRRIARKLGDDQIDDARCRGRDLRSQARAVSCVADVDREQHQSVWNQVQSPTKREGLRHTKSM